MCDAVQNILNVVKKRAVHSLSIPRWHEMKDCHTKDQIILHLQSEREIIQAKVKHDDRRSLLDVRQHIKNVETLRTEHELHIEVLQVALQKLQELGANVDSSNRALKKIGEKRAALECVKDPSSGILRSSFQRISIAIHILL